MALKKNMVQGIIQSLWDWIPIHTNVVITRTAEWNNNNRKNEEEERKKENDEGMHDWMKGKKRKGTEIKKERETDWLTDQMNERKKRERKKKEGKKERKRKKEGQEGRN